MAEAAKKCGVSKATLRYRFRAYESRMEENVLKALVKEGGISYNELWMQREYPGLGAEWGNKKLQDREMQRCRMGR